MRLSVSLAVALLWGCATPPQTPSNDTDAPPPGVTDTDPRDTDVAAADTDVVSDTDGISDTDDAPADTDLVSDTDDTDDAPVDTDLGSDTDDTDDPAVDTDTDGVVVGPDTDDPIDTDVPDTDVPDTDPVVPDTDLDTDVLDTDVLDTDSAAPDTDLDTDGCLPGESSDCDGLCWPDDTIDSLLGDEICDDGSSGGPNLDCDLYFWDDLDCTVEACTGQLVLPEWQGDGECDPFLLCPEFNFDDGDCDGEVFDDCDGAPVDAIDLPLYLGNGVCDDGSVGLNFNCPVWVFDMEDCLIEDCRGNMVPEDLVGNGVCNPSLYCDEYNFDDGDCDDIELDDCDAVTWPFADMFEAANNDICDDALDPATPNLACSAWGFDSGLCDVGDACEVEVLVVAGVYGSEQGWQLLDASGNVVAQVLPGSYPDHPPGGPAASAFASTVTLESGDYTVRLLDSWGDGWQGAAFLEVIHTDGTIMRRFYMPDQGPATTSYTEEEYALTLDCDVACVDNSQPDCNLARCVTDDELALWLGDGTCNAGVTVRAGSEYWGLPGDLYCEAYDLDDGDCDSCQVLVIMASETDGANQGWRLVDGGGGGTVYATGGYLAGVPYPPDHFSGHGVDVPGPGNYVLEMTAQNGTSWATATLGAVVDAYTGAILAVGTVPGGGQASIVANGVSCAGPSGCPAGESFDCNGTCFPNDTIDAAIADDVCDDGEAPGLNLNCATYGFDGGSCLESLCPDEEEADCDGACWSSDAISAVWGFAPCSDGSDGGPNLNCDTFAYDLFECPVP